MKKRIYLSIIMFICSMFFLTSCVMGTTYKVTFCDGDVILKEQQVAPGAKATAPIDPIKEGYDFVGWDQDFSNVQGNLVVNAIFEPKTLNVVFKDLDGNVLKEESVVAGNSATAPTAPTIEGLIFVGWDQDFANVTKDLEITAVYEKDPAYHEHEFVDGKCECGIDENTEFTVTFKDADGNLIEEVKVKVLTEAKAPSAPEKVGYKFVGWDKDISKIQKDLEVTAVYEVLTFKVVFKVEGEVVKEQIVEYGKNAVAPKAPTKEGYKFTGWDVKFTNVQEDLEVTAQFEKKSFTVTFLDALGKEISKQTVLYQEAAVEPENYDVEGYEFIEWDTDFSSVTKNITVQGIYNKVAGTIRYFDGDQELELSPASYKPGEKITLPVPTKVGYAFDGWYLSDISLTDYREINSDEVEDYVLYARFVEVEKQNQLVLPEAKYHFTGAKYGTTWQPVMPSDAPAGVTNYDWTTSDSSIATISMWSSISKKQNGYVIITATHKTDPSIVINGVFKMTSEGVELSSEEEANKIEVVTVTFVGKDDEVIVVKQAQKGGVVVPPLAPTYDGYAFTSWDKDYFNITEDTTIKAQYKEGSNPYAGKTFSIIGDSISTFDGFVPEGFKVFYPYPTADVELYETWWMRTITGVGGSLFVNNSYSGSCVADSSSSATKNESRLQHCIINGQAPDVILVFMGANDCASAYVTASAFDAGYKQMLDNLQKLCPNSEIILCTLPNNKLYTDANQVEFNNIIIKYAEEYNLKLVDTSSVNIEDHLCDSAHPLASGMELIANQMISELLK